ncbi:hypothetical protein SGLAD_v1c04290 [Spiroplasma gladiatoris]|uniref:Uncharacterized protein n=1 Tax=Spiroplasma gladiatoris TaxID=2143 RepID=A0A4P7AIP3_9MOLU|nr:hypothetical protein [Spiroplasma gladiatoris]QBQ07628.1 hypothetical protein SGLAD_v1c04290 [Spiroplasma gladiatoris]
MSIVFKVLLLFSYISSSVVPSTFFLDKQIINTVNNIENETPTYSYKDFLIEDKLLAKNINEDLLMYSGRVLKYYYAHYVTDIENDSLQIINQSIEFIDEYKTNSNDNEQTKKEKLKWQTFYQNLFLQNLIASTLNISVYGSKKDSEFFAEAFSKWLQTPKELRNKSWYFTNSFFIDIFPIIIESGQQLQDKTKKIISIIDNSSNWVENYNLNSQSIEDKVDLKYKDNNIGWNSDSNNVNYFNSSINNILEQCKIIQLKKDNKGSVDNSKKLLKSVLSRWMNDSFSKAPTKSSDYFENFDSKHFSSFKNLDDFLAKWSYDQIDYSTIWFSNIISYFKKEYGYNSTLGEDYVDWTTTIERNLQNKILQLFNYLFALIKNEKYLGNLISAFVVAGDSKLVDDNNGLSMGYTTSSSIKIDDNKYSIKSAYIVILGNCLTLKEFNSQYSTAYWSSPEMFHVLVHEFGHALDGFGAKNYTYRNTNFSNETYYSEYYEGRYVGGYNSVKVSDWEFYLTYTFAALSIVGSLCFLYGISRLKKARS